MDLVPQISGKTTDDTAYYSIQGSSLIFMFIIVIIIIIAIIQKKHSVYEVKSVSTFFLLRPLQAKSKNGSCLSGCFFLSTFPHKQLLPLA